MQDSNNEAVKIPVEVAVLGVSLIATIVRARVSRARKWTDVAIDALPTSVLVVVAYNALLALPERWGGPIPDDIALGCAAVVAIVGWEGVVHLARRVLGLSRN